MNNYFKKTLIVYPHRLPRHICRSHQTSVEQLNYHSLLPGNSRHSSMNTLELTFCHNDIVTQLELDAVGSDGNDMRILDGCEADEVVHCFILDCQRWITVGIVLTLGSVVEVIT